LGGHVSDSHRHWKMMFPEEEHSYDMTKLETGLTWEWATPLQRQKAEEEFRPRPAQSRRYSKEEQEIRRAMEQDGFKLGYVEKVLDPKTKGWESTMFWGMKPDGTLRWMQDLKALNRLMRKIAFKMEGDRHIAESMPQDSWLTTWDYRKFYWLFRLDRKSRRLGYLLFRPFNLYGTKCH